MAGKLGEILIRRGLLTHDQLQAALHDQGVSNALLGAMAQLPIRMAWAVRISATLAFIGVGVQAPAPEWGAMIRQGAEYVISGEWWVAAFPGLALILLVLMACVTGVSSLYLDAVDRKSTRLNSSHRT